MKATVLFLIYIFWASLAFAQIPILYYDFESNSNRTVFDRNPDQAINSGTFFERLNTGSITLTSAGGAGNSLYGGSQGVAIHSNKWNVNTSSNPADPGVNAAEYYHFTANTTGFAGITVSLDVQRNHSAHSPIRLGLLWSTDSVNYFTTSPVTLSGTTWARHSFTLPAAVENQSRVVIRIYGYGAANSSVYLTLDNVMVNASTITASKSLLDYSAIGLSLTSGAAFEPSYSNFNVEGTETVATMVSNLKLDGNLGLTAGTLNVGTNTLTVAGAVTRTSGVINASSGTMVFSGSSAQTIASGVFSGNINNLTVNNAAGVTTSANTTITTALTLTNGTYNIGSSTQTINGNIVRTNGVISAASGTMVFSGSSAQTIASAFLVVT
jgi:hypothetical protein